jgi:hypothetical protein
MSTYEVILKKKETSMVETQVMSHEEFDASIKEASYLLSGVLTPDGASDVRIVRALTLNLKVTKALWDRQASFDAAAAPILSKPMPVQNDDPDSLKVLYDLGKPNWPRTSYSQFKIIAEVLSVGSLAK